MRLPLLMLAAAIAWTTPAAAQMVRAQDPESVAKAMRGAGLTATMTKDGEGDPMIRSELNGTGFAVLFYNCSNHRECATVQFHVGYDLDGIKLEQVNEWNRTQRFGRAYLDKEGDPILQMDVDLDDGGLSTALFTDNVEFWTSVVKRFEKHIGYEK